MPFYGLDEEPVEVKKEEAKVVEIKPKRQPFAMWTVGENEYRLKLKTSAICQLEEKLKGNLLGILTGGDIPPLAIMLTVIQGAMKQWNHNIKYAEVQDIFDTYVDGGGTQLTLYTDVIIPVLTVSGFFTQNQVDAMGEKMEEAKELL